MKNTQNMLQVDCKICCNHNMFWAAVNSILTKN